MNQSSLFDSDAAPATPRKPYTGSVIYETKGKAREYRELACNLYQGCDHACVYCYAPNVLQRNRAQFHAATGERPDILKKLERDAAGYERAGERRQILFCFTCDPYSVAASQTTVTRQAIQICHNHGLNVCTLTKGGTRALRDLDLFTPRDSFATTLTSLDPLVSAEWEPGAALPADRCAALMEFHARCIPTWVSLEPVLDPSMVFEIIKKTAHYVDEYKVGVLNYHPRAQEIDWRKFGMDAIALLEKMGKRYYIKADLRKWLG